MNEDLHRHDLSDRAWSLLEPLLQKVPLQIISMFKNSLKE